MKNLWTAKRNRLSVKAELCIKVNFDFYVLSVTIFPGKVAVKNRIKCMEIAF